MRKLLIGLAAVSALSATAPAAAQYRDYWTSTRDWDISRERRLADLQRRLDADVRQGLVSWSELPRLRDLSYQARAMKTRYAVRGFDAWERADIDRAIGRFYTELHMAELYDNGRRVEDRGGPAPRYGWDNRGSVYGRDDGRADDDHGWDRDDGWDREDDARDERVYDRGGWNDGRSADRDDDEDDRGDQGWNDRDDDTPPGGRWNGGARSGNDPARAPLDLRVGDPAPVNLDAVPSQYRTRYPDGNGVYYRYDHGRIYQVDARTDTIRWVGTVD